MARPLDPQQDDPLPCFADFYRREYRLLLKVVMLLGGTLDEAHDSVNQAMADLIPGWTQIRHPHVYARRAVANNFIKNKMRDRKGLRKAIEGGHLAPEAYEDFGLTVWEDKEWVDQLVRSLPLAQREVVKAVLDGLAVEEISMRLGCTPATIRRRLTRATRSLVQLRKERGHGNDGGDIR